MDIQLITLGPEFGKHFLGYILSSIAVPEVMIDSVADHPIILPEHPFDRGLVIE